MKKTRTQIAALSFVTGLLGCLALSAVATEPPRFAVVLREEPRVGFFKRLFGSEGTPKLQKAFVGLVELPDLLDPERAETPHFRIVMGKGEPDPVTLERKDEAVRWAELQETDRLRAATLIYHLTVARNHFLDRYDSQEARDLGQIIVRMNLANSFDKIGLFANDAKDPQYNTAHTIPPLNPIHWEGIPVHKRPEPWKTEIWFRPAQKISMKEMMKNLTEDPLAPTLREARRTLYPMQINQATATLLHGLISAGPAVEQMTQGLMRQGGTLLLTEGAFQVMKLVNRALLPDEYYLDTGMVPEIIYHEYTHAVMSPYMIPTHATPVVEGMADYFAAEIAGTPQLAKKIKDFSTAIGKDGSKRQAFRTEYETLKKATADFVLSELWGLRRVFGERDASDLIWKTRLGLRSFDADIRARLYGGLRQSCREHYGLDSMMVSELNLYLRGFDFD